MMTSLFMLLINTSLCGIVLILYLVNAPSIVLFVRNMALVLGRLVNALPVYELQMLKKCFLHMHICHVSIIKLDH